MIVEIVTKLLENGAAPFKTEQASLVENGAAPFKNGHSIFKLEDGAAPFKNRASLKMEPNIYIKQFWCHDLLSWLTKGIKYKVPIVPILYLLHRIKFSNLGHGLFST